MRTSALGAGFVLFGTVLVLASSSAPQHRREPGARQEWKSVVYVRRDWESGISWLTARNYLLQQAPMKSRIFRLLSLWRYDPSTKKWIRENRNDDKPVEIKIPNTKVNNWEMDQTVFVLPTVIGLFWLEWSEDDRVVSSLAVNGPVICNDIEIGEPPKEMIAACVPAMDSARAMFVPDPAIHCRP